MDDEELRQVLDAMKKEGAEFCQFWLEEGEDWFMLAGASLIEELLELRSKDATVRR